jgi:hypothetical protein
MIFPAAEPIAHGIQKLGDGIMIFPAARPIVHGIQQQAIAIRLARAIGWKKRFLLGIYKPVLRMHSKIGRKEIRDDVFRENGVPCDLLLWHISQYGMKKHDFAVQLVDSNGVMGAHRHPVKPKRNCMYHDRGSLLIESVTQDVLSS